MPLNTRVVTPIAFDADVHALNLDPSRKGQTLLNEKLCNFLLKPIVESTALPTGKFSDTSAEGITKDLILTKKYVHVPVVHLQSPDRAHRFNSKLSRVLLCKQLLDEDFTLGEEIADLEAPARFGARNTHISMKNKEYPGRIIGNW
jgi:hypothetical protein